ncbi:MAG: c-type cytochrome [Stellaceae bacterium]
MRYSPFLLAAVAAATAFAAQAATPSDDAKQGAQLYRACAACHSLAPNRNMTGPSLARIWGRKAGSLKSFERYSPALRTSNVVWGKQTLDAWLKSPARFIPNNHMTFAGIPSAGQRADLIAFLKGAGSGQMPAAAQGGGMAPNFKDLKKAAPDRQVRSIRLCRDSYFVTTADSKTADFWEPNLRFETDSSDLGPPKGRPAIMPAGMMGDRAAVIFAAPGEISGFIKQQCDEGKDSP